MKAQQDGMIRPLCALARKVHGFLRGSVIIPNDADLTAPALDKPFAVETGALHR